MRPTSNTTYTANFTLQHFLSTSSSPTGPGVAGGGQWYDHNSTAFVGPAPTVAGYNFSFWRKDGQEIGTDPAGVSVTVDGPILVEAVFTPVGENRPPTISDGDFSPSAETIILFAGSSETFEARATDPDNNISSVVWYVNDVVVWDPGSDASIALTGDFPSSYDHTFAYPDTFIVKVTFTDAGGAAVSHSWTVQADPATEERAPTVEGVSPEESELSLYTNQTQEFIVEATDVNGDIVKWEWVVDKHIVPTDGHEEEEEFDEETGTITKEFSHTFVDDGRYKVTVTFFDSEDESGSVEWEVEVEDGPDLAVDEFELASLKPMAETGLVLPPPTLGEDFRVDLRVSYKGGQGVDDYEVIFYLKRPHWEIGKLFGVDRAFESETDIQLSGTYSDSFAFENESKGLVRSIHMPDTSSAGSYWLCAQIDPKTADGDPVPDPERDNNARCLLTYVVSHPDIARWVHPVVAHDGNLGNVWLGIPYRFYDPKETAKALESRYVYRIGLYRRIALELARRSAFESDGYLDKLELSESLNEISKAREVMEEILKLY